MVDDERAEVRDPELAARLAVEPLDDVTRRRLVSTALRAADAPPARPRRSRPWHWIAAAAAIVVVLAVTLAIVTAGGGNDEQSATGPTHAPTTAGTGALAPESLAAVPDVGDFGNLDQPANLSALQRALDGHDKLAAGEAAPNAPSADATSGATKGALPSGLQQCAALVPTNVTAIAQGTGTIDGRHATVLLVHDASGTRRVDAVLVDPCELRHLG